MPVEGSKAQIGRNLGLDFGAYVQGRSFTRSVSISDTVPDETSCANDSAKPISSTAYPGPSGRFASGGAASQPSPSPLSSGTATISPDSPFASVDSSPFPPDSNPHPLSLSTSAPAEPISSDASCQSEVPQSSVYNSEPQPSRVVTQPIKSSIPEVHTLLQNPDSHKTLNLLSHLVDSRVPPQWRDAFVFSRSTLTKHIRETRATDNGDELSSTSEILISSSSTDATDSSAAVRRPILPTPSPSEEISTVKRFKHDQTDTLDDQPQLTQSRTETSPALPPPCPSFVSPRLVSCTIRLADHFETRYHDKLGSLLDDVASLSESTTELSDTSEALPDTSRPTGSGDLHHGLCVVRDRFHIILRELFADRVNWGRIIAMLTSMRALCEYAECVPGRRRCGPNYLQSAVSPSSNETGPELSSVTEAVLVAPSPADTGSTPKECLTESTQFTTSSSDETNNNDDLHARSESSRLRAVHYVIWATQFIHGPEGIWTWIVANGGWEGLIRFESDRRLGEPTTFDDDQTLGDFTEDDTVRLLRRAVTGVTTLAVGAVSLMAAFHYLSKRF